MVGFTNAPGHLSAERTVSAAGRAAGHFDKLIRAGGGFSDVAQKPLAIKTKKGSLAAAEQSWKLLEKFKRRQGKVVAVRGAQQLEEELRDANDDSPL